MYISHRFDRHETLLRACYWLSQVGFDPSQMEVHTGKSPRLALNVEQMGKAFQARMIINAIESGAADSWSDLWDLAKLSPTVEPATSEPADPRSSRTAIGWHPETFSPPVDPELHAAFRGRTD